MAKISEVWAKVVRKSAAQHRLTLLYLANDVVQHAKKKGHKSLVDAFEKVVSESVPFLNDVSIKPAVSRVFNIWAERSIYPVSVIVDLKKRLGDPDPFKESAITGRLVAEFRLRSLLDCIERVERIEKESERKSENVSNSNITRLGNEILASLKDKSVAENLTSEFDAASVILEETISVLEREVIQRRKLLDELSKALVYYVIQGKEVEAIATAYKKIGANIALVKKRRSGKSEVASPVKDVPSPSDSDDGPFLPSEGKILPDGVGTVGKILPDGSRTVGKVPPDGVGTVGKGDQGQLSSLDQRLTLLMQGALESGVAPPQSINPTFRSSAASQPAVSGPGEKTKVSISVPTTPAPPVSQIQTIQSVITPRTDSQDLIQPTDMDLEASDEEMTDEYTLRLPGNKYQVQGNKYQVPSVKYQVPSINPENLLPISSSSNVSNMASSSRNFPPSGSMYLPPIHHQVSNSNNPNFVPLGHSTAGHSIAGHSIAGHSGHSSGSGHHGPGHLPDRTHHGHMDRSAPWPSPSSRDMDARSHVRGPLPPPSPERLSRMIGQFRSSSGRPSSGNNNYGRRDGW